MVTFDCDSFVSYKQCKRQDEKESVQMKNKIYLIDESVFIRRSSFVLKNNPVFCVI